MGKHSLAALLAGAGVVLASVAGAARAEPPPPPSIPIRPLMLAPVPAPYRAGDVLPCLQPDQDGAARDLCLLRLFVRRDGAEALKDWSEVYSDPALAGALGIDLDRAPETAPTGALDASPILAAVLALDRRGATPEAALKPLDQMAPPDALPGSKWSEIQALTSLTAMGRDPAFPLRRRPSPALTRAAEARLRADLAQTPPAQRWAAGDAYVKLLARLGDHAAAAKVEDEAWQGADLSSPDLRDQRIVRSAQLGRLDAAAQAALALPYAPAAGDPQLAAQDVGTVAVRQSVMLEAQRQGAHEPALTLARRLLRDACAEGSTVTYRTFQQAGAVIGKTAPPAEAAEWAARMATRGLPKTPDMPAADASDVSARSDAVLAAVRLYQAAGQPAAAHRVVEAWRPWAAGPAGAVVGSAARRALIAMLVSEGRIAEARDLAPNRATLLTEGEAGDVDRVLAALGPDERFAAVAGCASAPVYGDLAMACASRVEAAAVTPADKLAGALALLRANWAPTGPSTPDYIPPPSQADIEARLRSLGRLLQGAAADPASLNARLDSIRLRALVRKSLDARLLATRPPGV